MFKFVLIFGLIYVSAVSAGIVAPLAYSAPLIAAPAPIVTATSSQFVARNYNGIAAPLVAAPVAAPFAAPLAAPFAAPLAYSAYASPYAAAPLIL